MFFKKELSFINRFISASMLLDGLRPKLYTLDSGGVLWYYIGCPCVCLSIHLSDVSTYFCFHMITWVNVSGFSPNLVCALILKRSGLGLLMGKFCQFLTAICYFHYQVIMLVNISGFSPNLVCALILWRSAFGLLMGKFRHFLTELSGRNTSVF